VDGAGHTRVAELHRTQLPAGQVRYCLPHIEQSSVDGSILDCLSENDLIDELGISSKIIVKKLMNCTGEGLLRDQKRPSRLRQVRRDAEFGSGGAIEARDQQDERPPAAAHQLQGGGREGGTHQAQRALPHRTAQTGRSQ
jgi:hypothetical protein